MRTFGRCRGCGDALYEPDFKTCSRCASCEFTGKPVATPDGSGVCVDVLRSGSAIVELPGIGQRQYPLTAVTPAPAREPDQDDEREPQPAREVERNIPALCPEEDTRAAPESWQDASRSWRGLKRRAPRQPRRSELRGLRSATVAIASRCR